MIKGNNSPTMVGHSAARWCAFLTISGLALFIGGAAPVPQPPTNMPALDALLGDHARDFCVHSKEAQPKPDDEPKWTDDVLAVFTVVLAISTGALWFETFRLRRGADEQARHFDRSVAATEKLAIAGEKTAEAALLQAKVSEQALFKLERPMVYPSDIDLSVNGHDHQVRVKLKNYGRSAALLASVELIVSISPAGNLNNKLFHKRKGFMVENVIGPDGTTDYIIYSDPVLEQYWQTFEFGLNSLLVSINVTYGKMFGDGEMSDMRWFVWDHRRRRFFPGLQVWGG